MFVEIEIRKYGLIKPYQVPNTSAGAVTWKKKYILCQSVSNNNL